MSAAASPNGRDADNLERRQRGRLSDLDARLDAAKGRRQPPSQHAGRGAAIGMAFRMATELVAGVVVGGFIGYYLDKWLNTTPIFLLIFLGFGMAAGLANVIRTHGRMQADNSEGGGSGAQATITRDDEDD